MKKAVLLLLMVTIIAGCIYLKNADKDTVLYPLQTEEEQDVPVHQAESTEESISETATIEETISDVATKATSTYVIASIMVVIPDIRSCI